jgi:hypothetical protein
MVKRVVAGILWFYAGWYMGGTFALISGLPAFIGPLLGFCIAAFIAADPYGKIWGRTRTRSVAATAVPDAA